MTGGMITDQTKAEHQATWFVYAGNERIPFQRTMRGTWAFDVVCSCGWDSKLGGGTRTACRNALTDHRWTVQWEQERAADMIAQGLDPESDSDRMAYYRDQIKSLFPEV